MKNIFLLIFLLLIIGCEQSNPPKPKYDIVLTGTETNFDNFKESIEIRGETNIQGCEYLVICTTHGYNIPIHKGNCKNSIHHHILDSTKYIQKIEFDSMKIELLEHQIKILEKTNKQLFNQLKSKNNANN